MNAVAEKLNTETVSKRFPRRRIWTKKEYYKLIDIGFFVDKRAELIEGDIIEFSSMKSSHAVTIGLFTNVLKEVLSENYDIRGQLPIDFGEINEPEPDIAVVKGNPRDYLESHPNTAELIVEISAATLSYDRNTKAKLYARNNIQDYWIVNLRKRCIEVYRSPKSDKYQSVTTFTELDSISTLTKPENKLKVADLLP
jgi:Uma2 family endonuclease